MARERISNDAISTINGGLTAGATTVTVTDAAPFPTQGNFRIIVDNEIMLVTAVSGSDFTVSRGHESTTGVVHADGSVVALIITAGNLQQYVRDTVPMFDDSAQPLLNTMVTAGGAELAATDFTAVNQGTSTLTDYNSGGVALYLPAGATDSVRIYKRTAPSTPYTITAMVRGFLPSADGSFGIGFRESSTGKLLTMVQDVTGVTAQKWTNPTTFSANAGNAYTPFAGRVWVRIADNATNLITSISHDGINWTQTFSEGRTVFMAGGPDEVCILGNDGTANVDCYASVHNWIEG
ncbi:MAG: hypothetical protein ACYS7Y_28795 [Planctomycetota bacterium]|jgi:hypothetical protein